MSSIVRIVLFILAVHRKGRRLFRMLVFRVIYKTVVAHVFPRSRPHDSGHVCFRSADSDMLLQYQPLTQATGFPKEQPLEPPLSLSTHTHAHLVLSFSIFFQLLCYTMVENISADPPLSRQMHWRERGFFPCKKTECSIEEQRKRTEYFMPLLVLNSISSLQCETILRCLKNRQFLLSKIK